MSLLTVTQLTKAFGGVQAVDGVSFALERGELLALIGPNGAGKSTCFNLINGQLRPDAGHVLLEDNPITGWAPRRIWRMGVGRTFQVTETFASMTVQENVQMVLQSRARATFDMGRRFRTRFAEPARALLARLGVLELADQICALLSYGDLKRVELAMALAHEPKLLLMDEPTAGMGTQERDALMRLTAALVAERGIGVLFTEHSMDVVFRYAHRVLVMSRGKLIAQGSPQAVRGNADVQAVYLGTGATFSARPA